MNANHNALLKPAKGWILIKNGELNTVKRAVSDYDQLANYHPNHQYPVSIFPQKNRSVMLRFAQGLPVYDLTNLTAWLDAPPGQRTVFGALCWLTSPGSHKRYSLMPEAANHWGDTLIGASTDGGVVRLYLPTIELSPASVNLKPIEEPKNLQQTTFETLTITSNSEPGLANQDFIVNRTLDYDWNR